ncbi:molybdopterin synthase sulfur carrier subunit [Kaistia sp. 32K]|uniref:molybdopterin converting factor subunit 1 n=1 Tax=Kaistia sp. 32K TaxID=2795690 RepID=UPI001915D159|nr:molybdopterin converting factor subunit 1 [Kaistia sp. 32K]BCP52948.1 molybdopterin synthase sulfur carrier subunit [Kaistia sp. 32K]
MKLVYFAWVRERIGTAEETVAPPEGVETVGDLLGWLRTRGETYEYALAEPTAIRVALDHDHADHDAPLTGVREVALFPPMTGG